MNIYETLIKRRTIRHFKQDIVPKEVLEKCVNAARLAPSARNLQPCEFLIVQKEELLDEVYSTLRWAAYIEGGAPPPERRPTAYIVILLNREVREKGGEYDVGIAAMSITVVAQENDLGSCIIAAIDRNNLREILKIPQNFEMPLLVALGYPAEKSVAEEFKGSVKYWKDENNVLHVPKRKLEDVLHWDTF